MPFIYLPEQEHTNYLVDKYGPRTKPTGDYTTDFLRASDRRELLENGYLAMQVDAAWRETDRLLSHEIVMECMKGRAWALVALLAPLPDRPPLLHRGCEPCPIEGCLSSCLGDECVCSTGKHYPDTEFRICLNGPSAA